MVTKEEIMEEKEKGMDKKEFYKYLADLETLSEAQLIIVKNIIEGMLKPEWEKVAPIGVINTHVPPMDNIPDCCKNCPNFKEGAVCHCTLPYLEQQRKYDYTGGNVPPRTVITTGNTSDIYLNPNTIVTSDERVHRDIINKPISG